MMTKWIRTTAYPTALFLGMMLIVLLPFGCTLGLITWFLNG